MRWLILVALLGAGCGANPTGPGPTFRATVTATSPIIGACLDVRCAFTSVVTNQGPDCAADVRMSVEVTERPFLPAMAVGAMASGVLRAGQLVTVSGTDWPKDGIRIAAPIGSGVAMACP